MTPAAPVRIRCSAVRWSSHPAGDDRYVELGDEGLQVERLAVAGDALGGDDGPLDDQQVNTGRNQYRCQPLGVLRAHPHRGGHPGLADASHRGTQQVGI